MAKENETAGYLVEGATLTFDDLVKMAETLNGRPMTAEEEAEARAIWETSQKTPQGAHPARKE